MTKGQQGCIKTTATVGTDDGWKLWLVRTQARTQQAQRTYPVMLVPGLGSSGAYTFDLSPQVSFAEYLALQGWDVWTVELRGNGHSDKPSLLSSRSRWLTIDHYVERDLPALLRHVCMQTGCSAVHCMGHSMGGMVLTGVLARGDATSRRMRSVTLIGSSCFLEGSWWEAVKPTMAVAPLLYSVPAGATMRLYSNLAFTRLAVPALDILYFWPTNTDPALARAVLARNFSSISPGVVLQFRSAFKPSGLRSARAPDHPAFADPARLAAVRTPVLLICGDKDKMCPPQGARKQFEMLGSPHKKLIILGPASGQSSHMGHFDILMGKRATAEVFPCLHAWLEEHDHVMDLDSATMQPAAILSAQQQPATPCPTDHPALSTNSHIPVEAPPPSQQQNKLPEEEQDGEGGGLQQLGWAQADAQTQGEESQHPAPAPSCSTSTGCEAEGRGDLHMLQRQSTAGHILPPFTPSQPGQGALPCSCRYTQGDFGCPGGTWTAQVQAGEHGGPAEAWLGLGHRACCSPWRDGDRRQGGALGLRRPWARL